MFKKALVVLMLLFATSAYGATGATKISANTVEFSDAAEVITFNTTIRNILVINESSADKVFLTVDGLGWQSDGTYLMPDVQTSSTVGAIALEAGSSVTLDINTSKIGFVGYASATSDDKVQYVVTTEFSTQP